MQEKQNEAEEWPNPEPNTGFDWSLSMRDIEKKYSPLTPIIVKVNSGPAQIPERSKPDPGTLLAKFRKKYPFVYKILEETNTDLPRWLIDNMLKVSL